MTTLKELESKLKIQADKLNQLLQSAEIPLDLEEYEPHVQRLTEIIALLKGDIKTYPQAVAKWKENHALKVKGDISLPLAEGGIKTVAKVDLTGIPVHDGVANTWDEVAKVGAASDADALAGAPFDGIIEGSDYVNDKAEALKQHGFNLYMEKFDEAMHDPELAKRVEDKYLGKFPARWNLKPKN